MKLKQQPKKPNLPTLRERLGGLEEEEEEEEQEEQEEQEEEEENEEVVRRSHTGTAVCRRVTFPGTIRSSACTS